LSIDIDVSRGRTSGRSKHADYLRSALCAHVLNRHLKKGHVLIVRARICLIEAPLMSSSYNHAEPKCLAEGFLDLSTLSAYSVARESRTV
jgi:hypothetical protein